MVEKNIRIKMKGGGTRLQRVKVLASGKFKFIKNLGRKSTHSKKSATKHTKTRSVNRTVRRYGRRSHRGGKSLISGIEKIGTTVALIGPAVEVILSKRQPPLNWIVARYTGYSLDQGEFQWNRLVEGWGPVVGFTAARIGAHKIMGLLRRI